MTVHGNTHPEAGGRATERGGSTETHKVGRRYPQRQRERAEPGVGGGTSAAERSEVGTCTRT